MTKAPKLSDLQLVLLSAASQRDDGNVLPFPDRLANQKQRVEMAIETLVTRGLVEECITSNLAVAWREEGSTPIGLIITTAGHQALGLDEGMASTPNSITANYKTTDKFGALRPGSKQAILMDLIGRDNGATIDELILATDWLPHTTRAAISGLRKRGIPVISAREGGISRYRVSRAAE